LTKLVYYGITVGRGQTSQFDLNHCLTGSTGNQSLGEEYTDIWQYSSFSGRTPPSTRICGALIFLSTFPSYFCSKWAASPVVNMKFPRLAKLLKLLPSLVDVATEINLAIFYLRGTYYDLSKRLLGIQLVRLFSLIRFTGFMSIDNY